MKSRRGVFPVPAVFDRVDERADRLWEHFRGNAVVDRVFYTASDVGDFGMIWLTIAAAQGALGPYRKVPAAMRMALVLGAESVIVNGGLKSLFRRERPDWDQARPHALRKPKTSSFPSGHASSAVTAVLLLTEHRTRWSPLYWVLAGVVATSRVHVKIHHVSDVGAGLVVGAILGRIVRRIAPLAR